MHAASNQIVYSGSMMNTLDHIVGRTGNGHHNWVP